MTSSVKLTRDAELAWITLNRPEKRNAISVETMEELISASAEISRDDSIRAIIIDSTGKHFSVGADLSAPSAAEDTSLLERRRITETGQRLMRALQEIRQPTVAAVHGVAAGAGACIASVCDFRLGLTTSRISYGEVRFGMTLMWHALPVCVHLVGPSRARELLMTGQLKDAPTLLQWGFFNELADDEDSLSVLARTWAEGLAALPPLPVQMIKRSINAVAGALDAAVMHMDADQFLLSSNTEDARIAQRAFLNKSSADFSGR